MRLRRVEFKIIIASLTRIHSLTQPNQEGKFNFPTLYINTNYLHIPIHAVVLQTTLTYNNTSMSTNLKYIQVP